MDWEACFQNRTLLASPDSGNLWFQVTALRTVSHQRSHKRGVMREQGGRGKSAKRTDSQHLKGFECGSLGKTSNIGTTSTRIEIKGDDSRVEVKNARLRTGGSGNIANESTTTRSREIDPLLTFLLYKSLPSVAL